MEFIKSFGQAPERPVMVSINEALFYETTHPFDDPEIRLHLKDVREKTLGEKLKLLREGLKKLADKLEERENVKIITATSWIVAEHPSILRRLGFTVEEKTKAAIRHIKDYKNRMDKYSQLKDKTKDLPVVVPEEKMSTDAGYAYISREKLVELYGGKE